MALNSSSYGVGINLQDASIVINYDMSWTAINPFQRAGRILRFWDEKRQVFLYALKPDVAEAQENFDSKVLYPHSGRWDTMHNRNDVQVRLTDMGGVSRKDMSVDDLSELSSDEIQSLGELDKSKIDVGDISPILEHYSNLEVGNNKVIADNLPDDIRSVLEYDGDLVRVFVLVKVKDKYYWPVYNLSIDSLERPYSKRKLLDLISCTPETETALYPKRNVDRYGNRCVKIWSEKNGFDINECERICTLLLKPRNLNVELFEKRWKRQKKQPQLQLAI